MTTKQAAGIIKMLLGYLKGEIEPPKQETIEEARAFEQQGYECLEMAIKSLETIQRIDDVLNVEGMTEIDVLDEIMEAVSEFKYDCGVSE